MGKDFLAYTPKALETKWNFIKLKSFYTIKETINREKREITEWEKLASYVSDVGLIFRIYKELKHHYTKKTNNPVKQWAADLNRYFPKEDMKIASRYMEIASRYMEKCKSKS